jgi:predicted glycosyltransferase
VHATGDQFRLLIYSHDTFGLGHLRRCRAIAHALVDHRSDISVLILSGSPIIGSYGFRPRVDFVRFPGVVKLRNGDYSPRGLDISIEDAISIRIYSWSTRSHLVCAARLGRRLRC